MLRHCTSSRRTIHQPHGSYREWPKQSTRVSQRPKTMNSESWESWLKTLASTSQWRFHLCPRRLHSPILMLVSGILSEQSMAKSTMKPTPSPPRWQQRISNPPAFSVFVTDSCLTFQGEILFVVKLRDQEPSRKFFSELSQSLCTAQPHELWLRL